MIDGWDDLTPKAYRCILADPPWFFSGGKEGRPQHYARLRDHEIAAIPVASLAHEEGAWLFLWSTTPKLPDAIRIGEAWGFRWSGVGFTWVKLIAAASGRDPRWIHRPSIHMGQGYTTRKNTEPCLLFRKGSPKRLRSDVEEILFAPRREHSRKPEEVHARIEAFCAGPRVELFGRERRPGWDVAGNEVDKFGGDQ